MTPIACAVYTRKSSEEGLEQGFNSLDAQREACQAYILSQKAQGWKAVGCYDDGGYSGGNVDRPALQRLLADIAARRVRVIVVYKVDRLTRSLADFAKLVELFDAQGVSFVSVTQQFNTTTSMGRLTLNVLLSFAQFEREVTGERIRDKIAASKRKGMWMGGIAPLGYLPKDRSLVIDEPQAERVREMYRLYLELGCVRRLKAEIDRRGWATSARQGKRPGGGRPFSRGHLYRILANAIYTGRIVHKGALHPGQHPAIVEQVTWDAVQAQLAGNAQACDERSDAAQPSLLAGRVFDDQGRRLEPSHTKKGWKRYRYYVQQLGEDGAAALQRAVRIPAPEMELAVIRAIAEFLRDEQRLLMLIGTTSTSNARQRIAAAAALAKRLEDGPVVEQMAILVSLAQRVVFTGDELVVSLDVATLELPPQDSSPTIRVPIVLKRVGLAVKLIVRGPDEDAAGNVDPRLVALLVKARRWFEALSTGQHPGVLSLAQANGLASSDVTNTIYLAFLAPDLVHRIVQGGQPGWLGTKRLLAMAPLSMDWAEQRRVFATDDQS
jgi:site-specific DNA recombinase